jgi:hypothetical protein
VIEDIKLMAKSFDSCSFQHVYRVLNVATHNLARNFDFSVESVWRGVPSICIREALYNNIMIM